MGIYGKELILDIHNCDIKNFTRAAIKRYLISLCNKIDMHREDLHWWDYEGQSEEYEKAPDHLKGVSCIQFISTSSIVLHSLDVLKTIYLNIFSCKDFNVEEVVRFSEQYFSGKVVNKTVVNRI